MIGPNPAAQRHESNILSARPLQPARSHQPTRITQQDDLEQQFGRIGRSPRLLIGIESLKPLLLHPFFDQMMQSMFERTLDQLLFQVDGNHQVLPIIIRLETRHGTG